MHAISIGDFRTWCKASFGFGYRPSRLSYGTGGPYLVFGSRCRVKVRKLQFSPCLMAFEGENAYYGGALVLTSWDIGTPSIERSALRILEQMRRGYGVTASVENGPVQLFRSDEFADAQAFLTLPMIFGWDAYFMPHGTRYFAFIRRNNSIFLLTDEKEVFQKLLSFFEDRRPAVELPLSARREGRFVGRSQRKGRLQYSQSVGRSSGRSCTIVVFFGDSRSAGSLTGTLRDGLHGAGNTRRRDTKSHMGRKAFVRTRWGW